MTFKILLTDYEFEHLKYEEEIFQESGLDINFIKAQCKTEEEVMEHAKEADAILNQYAPISSTSHRVARKHENHFPLWCWRQYN